MPTQSTLKFRLTIAASAVIFLLSILVAFKTIMSSPEGKVADQTSIQAYERVETVQAPVVKDVSDWEPGRDHPVIDPTDFYIASDAPEVEIDPQLKYSQHQVSLQSGIQLYILQGGDLLANYCLMECRDLVTEQQILEAQLLTKPYNAKLEEIRRQRAEVLEQAGVTIENPEEELALIRIKAFNVYAEARRRIFNEVFDLKQRKLIYQNYQANHAEARQIREAKQTKALQDQEAEHSEGRSKEQTEVSKKLL